SLSSLRLLLRRLPGCTLFPYTTLFRSVVKAAGGVNGMAASFGNGVPGSLMREVSVGFDCTRASAILSSLQTNYSFITVLYTKCSSACWAAAALRSCAPVPRSASSSLPAMRKGAMTRRLDLTMLLLLTFSTGMVDAIGYLGFDKVFTGNMTGNVVILGMGLAGADGVPVLR